MEEVKAIIDKYKKIGSGIVDIKDVAEIIRLMQKDKEEQLAIQRVSVSLPTTDDIENEACEYVDNHIYATDGVDTKHETCRQWAFEAGAEWMKKSISNER